MLEDKGTQNEKHEDYLISLSGKNARAYLNVKLFFAAVGRILMTKGGSGPHLNAEEVHKYFPIFAQKMGWRGDYYRVGLDEFCPAVSIYFGGNVKSGYWTILPWLSDSHAPYRVDEHPRKERVLAAARHVCRAWLPDWNF